MSASNPSEQPPAARAGRKTGAKSAKSRSTRTPKAAAKNGPLATILPTKARGKAMEERAASAASGSAPETLLALVGEMPPKGTAITDTVRKALVGMFENTLIAHYPVAQAA